LFSETLERSNVMFETHERILQELGQSGQKQFSAEMIKGIIDKVEGEEIDKMHAEWLRDTDPYHEAAETSWEEATEDLGEIPYPELGQNTEIER
jgi:hypothetical protein